MRTVRGVLFAMFLAGQAAFSGTLPLTGPVVDPSNLLSGDSREKIELSARAFLKASDKWMAVAAVPDLAAVDFGTLYATTRAPWSTRRRGEAIGIVYLVSPASRGGQLLVVDPDWRKVAGELWIPLFPARIAEKFGDLPLEQRAVASAAYLAENFPDKIKFLMPETRRIDPDSLAVARALRRAFDWLFIFVILYTFFRTIWPNRLKDSDRDEQSEELRRLGREPPRW